MRASGCILLAAALLGVRAAVEPQQILLEDGSWEMPSVAELLQGLAQLDAPLPRPTVKVVPRQLQAAASPPVSAMSEPLTRIPSVAPALNQHIVSDGQMLVTDTLQLPFSAIGQIRIINNLTAGAVGFCSGSLVAPNVILTAGHCWFDQGSQSSAIAAVFVPAYNIYAPNSQSVAPFGVANVTAVKVHEGFVDCNDGPDCEDYDVAVMFLDAEFPQTLSMGYNSMLSDIETVYTAGYPGDKCIDGDGAGGISNFFTCPMWYTACPMSEYIDTNYTNSDSCFSGEGQSGSPMWIEPQPDELLVVGILTSTPPGDYDYSSDGESATLYTEITPLLYEQLTAWILDGPDTPSVNATLYSNADQNDYDGEYATA